MHFHNKRHPASMGDSEVECYLAHLCYNKKQQRRR
ncbi:hypothetical protein [uncultured Psychrosphaera sp.]